MYLLFGGANCYYASGGVHDFIDKSEDINWLIKKAQDIRRDGGSGTETPLDWWHIVDDYNMQIMWGTKDQPYGAKNLPGYKMRSTWTKVEEHS